MNQTTANKAIAALIVPVAFAILQGITTGVWDLQTLSTGIAGVVAGVIVYYVSNQPKDAGRGGRTPIPPDEGP